MCARFEPPLRQVAELSHGSRPVRGFQPLHSWALLGVGETVYFTRAQGVQYIENVPTMKTHGPIGFAAVLCICATDREEIRIALTNAKRSGARIVAKETRSQASTSLLSTLLQCRISTACRHHRNGRGLVPRNLFPGVRTPPKPGLRGLCGLRRGRRR